MTRPSPKQDAVLVGVHLPSVSDLEFASSMDELERLVSTLGYRAIGRVTQARSHLDAAAVLGEGKLKDLGNLTGGDGVVGSPAPKKKDKARLKRAAGARGDGTHDDSAASDDGDEEGDDGGGAGRGEGDGNDRGEADAVLVAVDHESSPSQARNLERATGAARARSHRRHRRDLPPPREEPRGAPPGGDRAAQLRRAAAARVARRQGTPARARRGRGGARARSPQDPRSHRRAAGGARGGRSASRMCGVRIAGRRVASRWSATRTRASRRSCARSPAATCYVEDKLFATLDTTVRVLQPETRPRILVSDTVGFIKKLPHDLVASFKSTLDEALEASHLLHVVDAADPSWPAQLEVTRDVLQEIGAGDVPSTLVMNKIDKLAPEDLRSLRIRLPEAWFVSAHAPADVAEVRERIIAIFEATYAEAEFVVPYDRQAVLSEMHEVGRVAEERYDESGVKVLFRAEPETIARLRTILARPAAVGRG